MADVSTHSTLPTNLIAYWEMEEASGTRADSTASGYDLSDGNTVTQATGRQGFGADFELSNSEYLNITQASGPNLNIAGDMSVAAWINMEQLASTIADNVVIVSKKSADGNDVAYEFTIDSSNNLEFQYQGTGGTTLSDTDSAQISVVNTWYHVAVTVDVSASSIIFYVNGSAVADTNVLSAATDMKSLSDGNFYVGADQVNTRYYMDGIIDELAVWSKILTSGEVTDLYNSGAGLPYQERDDVENTSIASGLVSYWEFEEASGTRADSVTGTGNDLTDNNTVTQGTGVQGNCADFESTNSEYLSIADASQTGLDLTSDMSFAGWVNFESTPGSGVQMSFVSKMNPSTDHAAYWFGLRNNGGTLELRYRNKNTADGNGTGYAQATVNWTPSTATWYHVGISHDASAGNAVFYVNGAQQGATQTGLNTSTVNSDCAFEIGRQNNTSEYMDGLMDEWGVWSRILSAGEFNSLYNGSSGIPYAAAAAATFTPIIIIS